MLLLTIPPYIQVLITVMGWTYLAFMNWNHAIDVIQARANTDQHVSRLSLSHEHSLSPSTCSSNGISGPTSHGQHGLYDALIPNHNLNNSLLISKPRDIHNNTYDQLGINNDFVHAHASSNQIISPLLSNLSNHIYNPSSPRGGHVSSISTAYTPPRAPAAVPSLSRSLTLPGPAVPRRDRSTSARSNLSNGGSGWGSEG